MLTFLQIKTIPPYILLIYTRRSDIFGDKVSLIVVCACIRNISLTSRVEKFWFHVNPANSIEHEWKISRYNIFFCFLLLEIRMSNYWIYKRFPIVTHDELNENKDISDSRRSRILLHCKVTLKKDLRTLVSKYELYCNFRFLQRSRQSNSCVSLFPFELSGRNRFLRSIESFCCRSTAIARCPRAANWRFGTNDCTTGNYGAPIGRLNARNPSRV